MENESGLFLDLIFFYSFLFFIMVFVLVVIILCMVGFIVDFFSSYNRQKLILKIKIRTECKKYNRSAFSKRIAYK